MIKQSKRQFEYRHLSSSVQRVILRLGGLEGAGGASQLRGAAAEEGAQFARELEFTAGAPDEALALRALGASLVAFRDAMGDFARHESHAGVVSAAAGLARTCADFVNPPLNAIWASASTSAAAGGGGAR